MFGRRRHCPMVGLSTDKDPIPLKSIKNRVCVKGFLAEVTSDLHYKNEDTKAVEAAFTFPLDDDCAVYQFKATIDGRVTEAEVQTKESAKQTYDEAIMNNETAFLIEESDTSGDIFKCKIGNLPPETEAVLSFSYVVDLASTSAEGAEDGSVVFTLPSVLNPRYSPEGFKPDFVDGVPIANQKSKYDFDFQLDIDPVFPVKNVGAFGDQVEVGFASSPEGPSKQLTTVKILEHKFDHDIRVKITYDRQMEPVAVFAPGRSEDDVGGFLRQHVVGLNFFPDLSAIKGAKLKKAEFVFIVDRSGSMGGSRMNAAKESLLLLLKSLPVGCSFNIVSFGNNFDLLFPDGSRPYSKETLDQAIELQKSMEANMGGTEILRPLKEVFSKAPAPGMPRQIFLITDGEVHNTNQVVQLVAANAASSRTFGIGIGEGASTSLLKGVARAGGGKAIFVTTSGQQRLQTKMMALLRQATQAFVDDVNVAISNLPDGVTCVTQIPEKAPPVYNGERLVMYAILAGDLKTTGAAVKEALAVLTGKIGDEEIRHELKVPLSAASTDAKMTTHRLAAKTFIKHLETKMSEAKDENDDGFGGPFGRRQIDSDDEVDGEKAKDMSAEAKAKKELRLKRKREIIVISTSANVASKFTAFVGVDPATKDKNAKAKVVLPPRPQMEMDNMCFSASAAMPRMRMKRCSAARPRMMACPAPPPQMMMKEFSATDVGACFGSAAPLASTRSKSGFMGNLLGGGKPKGIPKKKGMSKPKSYSPTSASSGDSDSDFACMDYSPPLSTSAAAAPPPPPPPPPKPAAPTKFGDALLDLIGLQSFDGSWNSSEAGFFEFIIDAAAAAAGSGGEVEKRCREFCASNPTQMATALAIAALKAGQSARQEEWAMIEEKAMDWLEGELGSPADASDLVAKAEKVLSG